MDNEIKPGYAHFKIGNFMFSVCAKAAKFLAKHRILYYLLACTWGILPTLGGLLVTLALAIAKIFDRKIKFEGYFWIYSIKAGPDLWGGFEMGLMFIRDHWSWAELSEHEFGHTFQNCLLGPFMIFIVSIPSTVRWWYRYLKYDRRGIIPPKDYSAIWFEDSADQCGKYVVKSIRASYEKK